MPGRPPARSTCAPALALALGLWTLTGCGGGEAGSIPPEEWKADAAAVCAFSQAEAEASQPVTAAGSPVPPVRAKADLARQQAEAIDDLGLPQGQARQARELVEALEQQAEALDRLADALLEDPAAAAGPSGAAVTVANDRVTRAATELGVAECTADAATSSSSLPGDPGTFDPGLGDGEGDGGGGFVEE